MRVGVAAWTGSANAGDELVHAGLRMHFDDLGLEIAMPSRSGLVLSSATHGVGALVLGGGGLLQDETSGANLPYHLAPVLAARVPVAGIGLGAGPLTTRPGQALVRLALRKTVATSVRDDASADLLARIGVPRPVVAADLALRLPRPRVEIDDVIIASLRPWSGRRHRLPVAFRQRTTPVDISHAERAAAALDAASARTGLGIRLVALEPPKDAPLLHAIADRLRAPCEVISPLPLDVPAVVGRGRVVVAMRYHAGIAAALAGRPVVLLGYSPKVGGLGTDLDVRTLPWDLADPAILAAAVVDALNRPAELLEARLAELQQRERRNRDVLEQLVLAATR